MRKHDDIYDEFFDDPLDDIDGFDGFILDPEDDTEDAWYKGAVEEVVYCDFGVGDDEGLCIKARYGCFYEGCPNASPNY